MKVLVATADTQGTRPTDYHRAIEGEFVWIQDPCSTDKNRMPNSSGCGRGFAGLTSSCPTTTAKIVDIPALDMATYIAAITTGLAHGGWPVEWAEDIALEQTEFAEDWTDGTVVERDLDLFTARVGGLLARRGTLGA